MSVKLKEWPCKGAWPKMKEDITVQPGGIQKALAMYFFREIREATEFTSGGTGDF